MDVTHRSNDPTLRLVFLSFSHFEVERKFLDLSLIKTYIQVFVY